MGKEWKRWLTLFFWAPKSLQVVIAAMKLKDTYSLEKILMLEGIGAGGRGDDRGWDGCLASPTWVWVNSGRWDGQGGLAGCYSWGHKESDTTERLNWTELLLGRKGMTNLNSILKNRHIPLPTEVHLVKAMVFPVVMYECESWTIEKAEHQKIGAFELWCWRRLLRVPCTARRSNQSILKEISPEYSLEGLMLKFQYLSHLMWRTDLFEKTLILGKIEGRTRRWWQRG